MDNERIVFRLNSLIEFGEKVIESQWVRERGSLKETFVDFGEMSGFRSACLSFISLIFGNTHPHYQEFSQAAKANKLGHAKAGVSILKSIKDEVEQGWLTSLKGLVSAEIFYNFLDMADHLLQNMYKDPAAVIIGSVLEGHLRELCGKNDIEITYESNGRILPKKADSMNSELAKNKIYNLLDQKNVTSWLDLRNKAAYGKYEEYSIEQVQLMYQGVLDFMTRNTI